jgi:pyrroloquinoline-quinone synthase
MSRDAVKNADVNGELFGSTLALKAWGRQQGQADDYIGVASLLVGMESQVPKIFRIMMNSLIEKYGFSKKEVVFYQVHIVADEEHGEIGFELLEKYADTPEKQEAAIKAIEETDRVRRTYFDGLYYGIVAPRLAQAAE